MNEWMKSVGKAYIFLHPKVKVSSFYRSSLNPAKDKAVVIRTFFFFYLLYFWLLDNFDDIFFSSTHEIVGAPMAYFLFSNLVKKTLSGNSCPVFIDLFLFIYLFE